LPQSLAEPFVVRNDGLAQLFVTRPVGFDRSGGPRLRNHALAGEVEGGRIARSRRPWGGADVIITSSQPKKSDAGGFYTEPRYAVTQHDLEFERLQETCSPALARLSPTREADHC